jgi:hypothetical protein
MMTATGVALGVLDFATALPAGCYREFLIPDASVFHRIRLSSTKRGSLRDPRFADGGY